MRKIIKKGELEMANEMTATADTKLKRGGQLFAVLQRVGRSFMLPIALLPIAGLLLGIGSSLTNQTMVNSFGLTGILGVGKPLYNIMLILADTGSIIFSNLPILIAMGIALGMANNEKGAAVLSAAISFFVMHQTISSCLNVSGELANPTLPDGSIANVVGIQSLEMGVFGGIVVGLIVAALHNRFYKIKLPNVVSFFGGVRFVPIISALAFVVIGAIMFFIWPFVQRGILGLGNLVLSSGYAGTFIYGVIERALIPFGLHHVFYLPFWQTGVGGSMMIDGVLVSGAQNIFFAELASPTVTKFSVSATRFMSGKFPLMIFGLPGAALAMYRAARPEKRRVAGGLLLSAALTSMLCGITEPLEFTFLFVAPLLYGIHCVFAGLAYMLMHLLNVGIGMTFSGGLIDYFLFGVLQGNAKSNWLMVLPVGAAYFLVYYLVFSVLIKKRNYVTPGREDADSETKLYTRSDYNKARADKSAKDKAEDGISDIIVAGLGGTGNIETIDSCATRLRVTVKDETLVSDAILRDTGASGVIHKGKGVQIIYGPRVTVIKSELEEFIGSSGN